MELEEFKRSVITLAENRGYIIETNRDGLQQINFGHKKLHENHLKDLYPKILEPEAHIPSLINQVAPGRPCTHKPMREIVQKLISPQFDGTRSS